jgi:hypothetical protein
MPYATRFLLFPGEWGNVWLARLNLTWERGFSLCLLRLCLGARSMSGLVFCACSAPGGGRGFAVCSAEPGTFRAKKPKSWQGLRKTSAGALEALSMEIVTTAETRAQHLGVPDIQLHIDWADSARSIMEITAAWAQPRRIVGGNRFAPSTLEGPQYKSQSAYRGRARHYY